MTDPTETTSDPSRSASLEGGSMDMTALERLLKRAARRLLAQNLLAGALWGIAAALVVSLLVVLFHRLVVPTWSLMPVLVVVNTMGPVTGLLAAAFRQRRGQIPTALELERRVDLRERFSSVLALQGETIHADVLEALSRDGERHARGVDLGRAIPYRRPLALLPALVALVILAGTVAFFPELDLLGAGEERQKVADAKQREKKRVDQLKKRQERRLKEIEKRTRETRVPKETKRVLAKMQERLAQESKEKQPSRRRALVGLQKTREELKTRRDREEMKQLDRLVSQMRRSMPMETSEGQQMSQDIKQGNLEKAAKAMQKMADKLEKAKKDGSMTPQEMAAVQRDMQKLMKDMDLPGLSDELAKAMQSSGSMDPSELAKMMGKAGADLSELARLMRERDLLDQALDEIKFSQDELASLPQEWPESDGT